MDKNKILDEIELRQLEILDLLGYDIEDSSIQETGMRVAKHLIEYQKNKRTDFEKIKS